MTPASTYIRAGYFLALILLSLLPVQFAFAGWGLFELKNTFLTCTTASDKYTDSLKIAISEGYESRWIVTVALVTAANNSNSEPGAQIIFQDVVTDKQSDRDFWRFLNEEKHFAVEIDKNLATGKGMVSALFDNTWLPNLAVSSWIEYENLTCEPNAKFTAYIWRK
jgi:hypothetical protein